MRKSVVLFVSVLCVGFASRAAAQPQILDGKLAVTVSGGVQPGSQNADRRATFSLYDEDALIDTQHEIDGGGFFDIGASYKIRGSLAAGLSYSRLAGSSSDVRISGQLPHPLFTNRPRSFTASANGLDHGEQAVHLQAIWLIPFTDKIDFSVAAGPSFFSLSQEFTRDIGFTEGPPDSVNVDRVGVVKLKESATGFNIGGDASYLFTRTVRGVFTLRYTRASADFDLGDGNTVNLDAGNVQIGFGARVTF